MASHEVGPSKPLPLGSRTLNVLPRSTSSQPMAKLRRQDGQSPLPPTPPRTRSPTEDSNRMSSTPARKSSPPSPSPNKSMRPISRQASLQPSTPARAFEPKRSRPLISPALNSDGISPNPRERKRVDERVTPARGRLGSIEEIRASRSHRWDASFAPETVLAPSTHDAGSSASDGDSEEVDAGNQASRDHPHHSQMTRSSRSSSPHNPRHVNSPLQVTSSRARQAALDRDLLAISESLYNTSSSSVDASLSLSRGSDTSGCRRSQRAMTQTIHGKGTWPALAPAPAKTASAVKENPQRGGKRVSPSQIKPPSADQEASQASQQSSSEKSIRKNKKSNQSARPRVSFSQPLPSLKHSQPSVGDPRPPANRRRATSSQPFRTPTKAWASTAEKRAYLSTIKRLPPLRPDERLTPFVPAPSSPGDDPILLKGHPDEDEPEWARGCEEGDGNDTFAAVRSRTKAVGRPTAADEDGYFAQDGYEGRRHEEGRHQETEEMTGQEVHDQAHPDADTSDLSRLASEIRDSVFDADPFTIGYEEGDFGIFDLGVGHSVSDDDDDEDVSNQDALLRADVAPVQQDPTSPKMQSEGTKPDSSENDDLPYDSLYIPHHIIAKGEEQRDATDTSHTAEEEVRIEKAPMIHTYTSKYQNQYTEDGGLEELSFIVEQRELRQEEDEGQDGALSLSDQREGDVTEGESRELATERNSGVERDANESGVEHLGTHHNLQQQEEENDLSISFDALAVDAQTINAGEEDTQKADVVITMRQGAHEVTCGSAGLEPVVSQEQCEPVEIVVQQQECQQSLVGTTAVDKSVDAPQLFGHALDKQLQGDSIVARPLTDHSYLHTQSSRSIMHSMERPTSIVEVMSTDAEAAARAAAILRVHHKWIHEGHVVSGDSDEAEATFLGNVLQDGHNETTCFGDDVLPDLLSQAELKLRAAEEMNESSAKVTTPRASTAESAATPTAPGAWSFSPAVHVDESRPTAPSQAAQLTNRNSQVDLHALLAEDASVFPRPAWRALDKTFRRKVRELAEASMGSDEQPSLPTQRRAARLIDCSTVVDAFLARQALDRSMLKKRWSYSNLLRSVQALQRHWFIQLERDYPVCLTAEEAVLAEKAIQYSDGISTSSMTRQSSPAMSQILRYESSLGDLSPSVGKTDGANFNVNSVEMAIHSTPLHIGKRTLGLFHNPVPSPISSQASPFREQRLQDSQSDDEDEVDQSLPAISRRLSPSVQSSPKSLNLVQRSSVIFKQKTSILSGQPLDGFSTAVEMPPASRGAVDGTADVAEIVETKRSQDVENGDGKEDESLSMQSLYPALPLPASLAPPAPPEPSKADLSPSSCMAPLGRQDLKASQETAVHQTSASVEDASLSNDSMNNVSTSSSSLAEEAAAAAAQMAKRRQLNSMASFTRQWNAGSACAPSLGTSSSPTRKTTGRANEKSPPSKRHIHSDPVTSSPRTRSSLSLAVRASASTLLPTNTARYTPPNNHHTGVRGGGTSIRGSSSFVRPTVLAGLTQQAHQDARAKASSFEASRRQRTWISPLKKRSLLRERLLKEGKEEKLNELELNRKKREFSSRCEKQGEKENVASSSSFSFSSSQSTSSFDASNVMLGERSFEDKRAAWNQRIRISKPSGVSPSLPLPLHSSSASSSSLRKSSSTGSGEKTSSRSDLRINSSSKVKVNLKRL